ncbi:MAG: hypothetical protein LPK58_08660 [Gammaproteobacteria bacterium]|nr:hypothetical protein [Gammaproteobacteria bacterium]
MPMTFAEFLRRIDTYCDHRVLAGTPAGTFAAVQDGTHPDAAYGPLLKTLLDWCAVRSADTRVERAALVNALGPLRLGYQQEGASQAGYAELAALIRAIDAAFDDARLEASERDLH